MTKLTFITGNAAKAKYLAEHFHLEVEHRKLDLVEIQSLSLSEVVEDKARRAYEILKTPVLVEDVSLIFNALNTLPGPLVKWFLKSLGNDGLCHLLDGYNDRSAIAEVEFALCDENGVHTFNGSTSGTIAKSPRGNVGFGWDPIFVPDGHEQTWSEMSDADKHETSMRKPALEKLAAYLAIAS